MASETIAAADLLGRIGRAWDGLQEAVAAHGGGRLDVPTPNGWSLKDHLAHVADWEGYLLAMLEGRDPHAALGVSPGAGETEENEALLARHAGDSAEHVRDLSERTHASVLHAIAALGDEGLARPRAAYQPDAEPGQPIIGVVLGNTVGHYEEHAGWISGRDAGPS